MNWNPVSGRKPGCVRAPNGVAVFASWIVFGLTLMMATPALHAQWSSADIGNTGAAGSDSATGSGVTVSGAGADIWDTADAFHFRYQTINGNGTFVARVTHVDNTDGWAKAGIMLRESLAPGSRHVFVALNAANHGALFSRATTGGTTAFSLAAYDYAPMWLKLSRNGNTYEAFQSTDGSNWVPIGSAINITLPDTVYAGFAVSSHNYGTLCTATFDSVQFASALPSGP